MSGDADRGDALDGLEDALGYHFDRRARLEDALRHSSYTHEHASGPESEGPFENNERLEVLGDAVLAVVVAHSLYMAKPDWREGDLTRALHALVEGRSLEKLARSSFESVAATAMTGVNAAGYRSYDESSLPAPATSTTPLLNATVVKVTETLCV